MSNFIESDIIEIVQENEDNLQIPVAQDGIREDYTPIEEMGRVRSWVVQSAQIEREQKEKIEGVLEQPGTLYVLGKILHPNEEVELFLNSITEITDINYIRDDLMYEIEFRLKDADGLYGGPVDITPKYADVHFTFTDENDEPLEDLKVNMFGISHTTSSDGKAIFNNAVPIEYFSFSEGDWVSDEGTYDYVFEYDGFHENEAEDGRYAVEFEGVISSYENQDYTDDLLIDEAKTYELNYRIYTDVYIREELEEEIKLNTQIDEIEWEDMHYDVNFTLLEYGTENPIEGAEITLSNNPDIGYDKTETVTTDSNGQATIETILLSNEIGEFEITHPDYYSNLEYTNMNFEKMTVFGMDGAFHKYIDTTIYLQPTTEELPGIDDEIIQPQIDFSLEFQEILASCDFLITDDNGDPLEGVTLSFVNHHGDYVEVVTDTDGVVVTNHFRWDESYDITMEHPDYETNTQPIMLPDDENDYYEEDGAFIHERTLRINQGIHNEENEMSVDLDYLVFEGGMYVDFSETDILDEWKQRYRESDETWSVVDNTDARGGKELKHESTQNYRRLYSYEPFWLLYKDGDFGEKVWENQEVMAKVKTTEEHGNQIRLHVRSGLNIIEELNRDEESEVIPEINRVRFQNSYDLKFVVRDDTTDDLLDGATITLTLDYGLTEEQTTDSNGETTFSDLDDGTETIEYLIERSGYEPLEDEVTIESDDSLVEVTEYLTEM